MIISRALKNFIYVSFFLLGFLIAKVCLGEPLYGQDYLGQRNKQFNFKAAASLLPPGTPVGDLYFSFGTSSDSESFLLSNVRPAYFRVHLINSTCIRNHNCGPYEIGYGFTKASFDAAVRNRNPKILNFVRNGTTLYKRMADFSPGTRIIISPALEHDLSTQSWRILADEVLKVWPEVQLDNSPDGGIAVERYKGAWIERHGVTNIRDADIISTDGVDITDADVEALKARGKNAKIIFGWTRSYNCRTNGVEWIDPRARTACPSGKTFELSAHIFDDRGAAPPLHFAGCKVVKAFTPPYVWKPLAEDSNHNPPGDNRPNLPVAITAFKADIDILAGNGTSVGRLGFYGPYQKLYRAYSGYKSGSRISGFEFEKRAKALAGSSYTWLRNGNTCLGPVIGGRRNGSFR